MNTPIELTQPLLTYVKEKHPAMRPVALVNKRVWETLGVRILAADLYERGTTDFQPIAAKITAPKPDALDLGTVPPGDGGSILKKLRVLGWDGVKIERTGTGTDGLVTTAREAANGTCLGSAIPFDGELATAKRKIPNAAARAVTGENSNGVTIIATRSPSHTAPIFSRTVA